MVEVNCVALLANLIESELFGMEKEVLQALMSKTSEIELANHGTLFLDEIGEMPLDLQVKILHALQEGKIEGHEAKDDENQVAHHCGDEP